MTFPESHTMACHAVEYAIGGHNYYLIDLNRALGREGVTWVTDVIEVASDSSHSTPMCQPFNLSTLIRKMWYMVRKAEIE